MENNIFKFAPNELVQDAFLCWLFNWINIEEDEEDIKIVAKDILSQIIKDYDENVNIKDINFNNLQIMPQYSINLDNYRKYDEDNKKIFKEKENIKKLNGRIDILVVVDKYAIIIEDKVNTSEHDFQIFQYKKSLKEKIAEISKKDNLCIDEQQLFNKQVIACYYKIYDEYNIENKSYIDSFFYRERILNILKKYSNINNLYFLQYISYLEKIEYYSKTCNKIVDLKADNNLKEKVIIDIRALGLLKELQKWIENSNCFENTSIYWGKSNEGNKDTWWENIETNCYVENSKTFSRKAYLKINAYENENIKIRLMIGKKKYNVHNNESRPEKIKFIYEYSDFDFNKVKDTVNWDSCIIAKYQEKNKNYNTQKNEIYKELENHGIIEEIKKNIKYPINPGGNPGNYEITIFTIQTDLKVYSENVYEELKELVTTLEQCMNNVKIYKLQGI